MVDSGPLATRQSVRHPFLIQLGRLLLHISNNDIVDLFLREALSFFVVRDTLSWVRQNVAMTDGTKQDTMRKPYNSVVVLIGRRKEENLKKMMLLSPFLEK